MAIVSNEAPSAKKAKKVLSHIEIHPQLGGGHMVKHVYSGYGHEPLEVSFNKNGRAKGGEHIQQHLDKHAGLPPSAEAAREEQREIESD